jgi:hypothetical protein
MSLSACNKEVATRLFRMLALSEMDAAAVKADHASYAKLSLLTQQANLLQRQAVHVVNRSAASAAERGDLQPVLDEAQCTALSADYDDGTKRLLGVLAVNDLTVAAIQRDQAACAKLSLLADQVGLLQEQAQQVFDEADLNRRLTAISATSACRLVPGTTYYHYTQSGKQTLSRIADDEWSNYESFHGKYLYDFDFVFRRLDAGNGDENVEDVLELLPCALIQAPRTAPSTHFAEAALATCHESSEPVRPAGGAQKPAPICGRLSRW